MEENRVNLISFDLHHFIPNTLHYLQKRFLHLILVITYQKVIQLLIINVLIPLFEDPPAEFMHFMVDEGCCGVLLVKRDKIL